MITQRESESSYIIDFFEDDDWEGFDNIMLKLKNNFSAEIIEEVNGPESRICDIKIEDLPFSLHNNPYGNYLKASSTGSIQYLKNKIEKFKTIFT